jgi:hypothetical protein
MEILAWRMLLISSWDAYLLAAEFASFSPGGRGERTVAEGDDRPESSRCQDGNYSTWQGMLRELDLATRDCNAVDWRRIKK